METEVKKQLIPWQRRRIRGNTEAFWDTVILVLLKPKEFFSSLEVRNSFFEPLLFNFIINATASAFAFIAGILLFEKQKVWLANFFSIFVIIPMLSILSLYCLSLVLHFFAKLFKTNGKYKDTFNIVAYAGAANIVNAIPFLGGYIGSLWCAILYAIGLRKIYQLSLLKSILASFLTIIIVYSSIFLFVNEMQKSYRKVMLQNERIVEGTLKKIATAVETYAKDNSGVYPKDEYDLRYGKTAYLDRAYNNESIQGYSFLLNLTPKDYELLAAPVECTVTGTRVYKITTGGMMKKGSCEQLNK